MTNRLVSVSPQRRAHFNGRVQVKRPSFGTFVNTVFLAKIPSTIRYGSLAFLGATAGVAADMQLFIGGQSVQWRESTLSIDLILGAAGRATFTLDSTTTGLVSTYRPNVYDEVIFYRQGVRRFGGLVQSVVDTLTPGTDTHEMAVTCTDYMGYLDRVLVSKLYTVSMGSLAWIIIFDIVQVYLKQFGIGFAGFASSGAAVGEVLFHYITAAQAVAQLVSAAPGIYCWIDAYKMLHFSSAGGAAPAGFGVAPYSITDTSRNYFDFQVSVDGTLYRNKQWVLPSANVLSLRVETFIGDGSTTGFVTQYVLNNAPVVTVNGNNQTVATLGGAMPAGWTWYFIPGGQGVFQRTGQTPLAITDTLLVAYPSPFALAVSAQNDAEIAAKGLVEAIAQPQNVIDLATAQAMATGLLNAYCPNPPQTIVFSADEQNDSRWLTPGMTMPISKTLPAAAGTFVVQQVSSQEYGLTTFKHTVTLQSNTGNLNPQLGLATLAGQALAASNNNNTQVATFTASGGGSSDNGIIAYV